MKMMMVIIIRIVCYSQQCHWWWLVGRRSSNYIGFIHGDYGGVDSYCYGSLLTLLCCYFMVSSMRIGVRQMGIMMKRRRSFSYIICVVHDYQYKITIILIISLISPYISRFVEFYFHRNQSNVIFSIYIWFTLNIMSPDKRRMMITQSYSLPFSSLHCQF